MTPLGSSSLSFVTKDASYLQKKILLCHDIGPWKIKYHQGKLSFCARDVQLTRAKWEAVRVLLV